MKPTNFDQRIDRETAIFLLENNLFNDDGLGCIMCKEVGQDEDWQSVTKDDLDVMKDTGGGLKTFEIWLHENAAAAADRR